MASLHGRKGFLSISGLEAGVVQNVSGFALDDKVDPMEDTALAATNPVFKTWNFDGLREFDGTIDFVADDVGNIPNSGDTISVTFNLDSNTNFIGQFGIVNSSVKVERNDLQRVTLTVKGSGLITKTEGA